MSHIILNHLNDDTKQFYKDSQKTVTKSISKTRTLLGFDYGLKRIGVAVGQELTGTASALVTLRANDGKPDWDAITRLIEQWQPDALVVGLPLNMDGTFHELSYRVQRFGNQLNGRYNLRAYFIDERLSSLEAERELQSKSRKVQKAEIDKVAAKVILESWLMQQELNPDNEQK